MNHEVMEVLRSLQEQNAAMQRKLDQLLAVSHEPAGDSLELTMCLSADDPLAALRERNRRLVADGKVVGKNGRKLRLPARAG